MTIEELINNDKDGSMLSLEQIYQIHDELLLELCICLNNCGDCPDYENCNNLAVRTYVKAITEKEVILNAELPERILAEYITIARKYKYSVKFLEADEIYIAVFRLEDKEWHSMIWFLRSENCIALQWWYKGSYYSSVFVWQLMVELDRRFYVRI